MTMKVRLGGVWKDISAGKVFKGGSWRTLLAVKIYKGGAWRDVANFTPPSPPPSGGGSGGGGGGGTLSLTASPTSLATESFSSPMTSDPCTITPAGGHAPYTYAWTIISGGCTINSPSSATTTFTKATSGFASATARCTATDSLGVTASIDVPLTFERLGL